MKLRVSNKTIEKWQILLNEAGDRETGGILFGEHTGESDFRIVEATVQSRGGSQAHFRRNATKARNEVKRLSAQFDHNHLKFNYLGEWHSHPNSIVLPSALDEATMTSILEDPDTDANFLVLVIVRLDEEDNVEMSATAYLASGHVIQCEVETEDEGKTSNDN